MRRDLFHMKWACISMAKKLSMNLPKAGYFFHALNTSYTWTPPLTAHEGNFLAAELRSKSETTSKSSRVTSLRWRIKSMCVMAAHSEYLLQATATVTEDKFEKRILHKCFVFFPDSWNHKESRGGQKSRKSLYYVTLFCRKYIFDTIGKK